MMNQQGGQKASSSSHVAQLPGRSRDEKTERQKIQIRYRQLLKREVETGDLTHQTSRAYKRYENQRMALLQNPGLPPPNIVKKLRRLKENYLQKLEGLDETNPLSGTRTGAQRTFLETWVRLKKTPFSTRVSRDLGQIGKSPPVSGRRPAEIPLWGPRQRERAPPTSDEQWDTFLDKVREAAAINQATEQRVRLLEDWKNYPRKPTKEEKEEKEQSDWQAFMDYWNDPRTSDERERDVQREREQRQQEKEQSDWQAFMEKFRGMVDMDYWNDPRTSDERERDVQRADAVREAEAREKTKRAQAFAKAEQQQRSAWEQQRVIWEGLMEAFLQRFGDSPTATTEGLERTKPTALSIVKPTALSIVKPTEEKQSRESDSMEGLDDEAERNIQMLERLKSVDDAVERAKIRKTHLENVRRVATDWQNRLFPSKEKKIETALSIVFPPPEKKPAVETVSTTRKKPTVETVDEKKSQKGIERQSEAQESKGVMWEMLERIYPSFAQELATLWPKEKTDPKEL